MSLPRVNPQLSHSGATCRWREVSESDSSGSESGDSESSTSTGVTIPMDRAEIELLNSLALNLAGLDLATSTARAPHSGPVVPISLAPQHSSCVPHIVANTDRCKTTGSVETIRMSNKVSEDGNAGENSRREPVERVLPTDNFRFSWQQPPAAKNIVYKNVGGNWRNYHLSLSEKDLEKYKYFR